MMRYRDALLSHAMALSAMITPSLASAVGIGSIEVRSALGQPLLAAIPLLSSPGEEIPALACFKAVPGTGEAGDVPAVGGISFELKNSDGRDYLWLSSRRPVTDPIASLTVEIGCGTQIRRDYTILLSPSEYPIVAASTAGSAPAVAWEAPPPARSATVWQLAEDESLASLAASLYPHSPKMRRRLIAAVREANPEIGDIAARQAFAAGTTLKMPDLRRLNAPPPTRRPAPPVASRESSATEAGKRVPPANETKARAGSGDRLVLSRAEIDAASAGPPGALASVQGEQAGPLGKPAPEKQSLPVLEEKIIALQKRAEDLRQQLEFTEHQYAELLQRLKQAPAPDFRAVPAALAAAGSTGAASARAAEHWLDVLRLLFASMIGGLIAACGLIWANRRSTLSSGHSGTIAGGEASGRHWTLRPAGVITPRTRRPAEEDEDSRDALAPLHAPVALVADEVNSLLHDAEALARSGNVKLAISILENLVAAHPRQALAAQALLLRLYHEENLRSSFLALQADLELETGIPAAGWPESTQALDEMLSRLRGLEVVDAQS